MHMSQLAGTSRVDKMFNLASQAWRCNLMPPNDVDESQFAVADQLIASELRVIDKNDNAIEAKRYSKGCCDPGNREKRK